MFRTIAIAAFAATMLACLPAQAQEPTLDGAPGYLAQQEAARKAEAQKKAAQQAAQKKTQQAQTQAPPAADKLKADQAKLAQQADALKAEQARLERLAEDLKAQQARLDARAAEMAEERMRLLQARVDQASEAAKPAAPPGSRDEAVENEDLRAEGLPNEDFGNRLPGASPELPRPLYARFDFDAARRSCLRVAEDRALARDFYSARYDVPPRFYQNDGWELRGRMRLEDRRGYLLADTVCEIDADNEVRNFIFLR